MKNLGRLPIFCVVGLIVAGCTGGEKSDPAKADNAKPAESKTPVVEKPSVDAALQHEGFLYYGLGNGKAVKMKLTQAGSVVEGEQSFELESADASSAVFKQVWSGGLPASDSKLKVTADGVYGIEAKGTKIDPPQMEMPAKPTPGFTWNSDAKIEVDGSTISNSTGKVVGIQPLKLGGKTIQALVLKRTSKVTSGAISQNMATTEYYEKGVGAVRLEVTMSGGGQPTRTFSMEAMP